MPKRDALYRALLNKDSSFEGIFIVGVKTTGIFCRPTCTARKPKKENIEFFLQSGRPSNEDTGRVKSAIQWATEEKSLPG